MSRSRNGANRGPSSRVPADNAAIHSDELLAITTRVAESARRGEEVEAYAVHEHETQVRAYRGKMESLASAVVQGIGVRVVRDGQQGLSYAVTFDDETLKRTIEEARENCRFTSHDEFAGVASPDGVEPVSLDLYDPGLLDYDTDAKISLAVELERATLGADPRVTGVEVAEYCDTATSTAVATSVGVAASSSETGCLLAVYSLAEERGETQTGFGYSVGRHPDELSVEKAAADAAERSTRLLGAKQAETQRLSVVLDPPVTAKFLGIIGATLSGESVLKGRSLMAGRLDSEVAAHSITLLDDATEPAAFSACAIDAEGLATRRLPLIVDGVLRAYMYDTYTARRAGVSSTGSAVRNGFVGMPAVGAHALRLLPGERPQSELLADIDNGLLVQGVVGLHSGINPVSGDFSIGAEGMRIRNGATAEPVREVTIASTLQRLLLNVIEVGSDLEWLPMHAAGVSLAIADVTMSGS